MVASTALRERAFADVQRLCYAGLDATMLLREVARRVQRVVPFEAYCATANDPLSGLLTRLVSDEAFGDREHRAAHAIDLHLVAAGTLDLHQPAARLCVDPHDVVVARDATPCIDHRARDHVGGRLERTEDGTEPGARRVEDRDVVIAPRIGIKKAADWPLMWYVRNNEFVSRR